MTFDDLSLATPILRALETEGYTHPTPIQAQAIPAVLAGSDLLGIAQTGTGKTAAFALPILDRLGQAGRRAPARSCRALVLAPTRELASQIGESFRAYGRNLGLTVAVVFGGVPHRPQITALTRGVDVLVATPGRLLDHMAARVVTLAATEVFVLDEADQMLDLGFLPPIRRIVRELPRARQSLFFSATMPPDIARLADELLTDPVKVAVARVGTPAELVSQRVVHVAQKRKAALLVELLAHPAMTRTLVFTRTKRGADRVSRHLEAAGLAAAAIHGNKSQRQREVALEAFRAGGIRVLVATDIAARGIDIDGITHVVNYDLPDVPEAYVHRIGRTARAGATGHAVAFCDPEEQGLLRAIERLTRRSIPAEDRRDDRTLSAGDVEGRDRFARPGRGRPQAPPSRGREAPRDRPQSRNGAPRKAQLHREAASDARRPRHEPAAASSAGPNRGEPRQIADVAFLARVPRGQGGRGPKPRDHGNGRSHGPARQRSPVGR
jgi:ATP-dependent RNA helicase RhlE